MANVVVLSKEEYREMNHIPKLRGNAKGRPDYPGFTEILPVPQNPFRGSRNLNSPEYIDVKKLRHSLSPINHNESVNENNETLRAIEMLDREKLNIQTYSNHKSNPKSEKDLDNLHSEALLLSKERIGWNREDLMKEREIFENAKKVYDEEISKIIDLRTSLEKNIKSQVSKRGMKVRKFYIKLKELEYKTILKNDKRVLNFSL